MSGHKIGFSRTGKCIGEHLLIKMALVRCTCIWHIEFDRLVRVLPDPDCTAHTKVNVT